MTETEPEKPMLVFTVFVRNGTYSIEIQNNSGADIPASELAELLHWMADGFETHNIQRVR